MLGGAVVLLIVVIVWVFTSSNVASGDPGGRVMDQLTPTVSSLPGFGMAALPWVSRMPQSLAAPYAIKIEAFRDSCDGRAGTQGWSQVVVQAGFTWTKGFSTLISYMAPRLTKVGWSLVEHPRPSIPPSQDWTKTLSNGARADLNVQQFQGTPSSHWQLDATTRPVGKAASGC